ncbi:hypothetical protein IE81DRAFT_18808 [Ceraceosorus guamensis]|uniref:Uncharacterized protein n=1 Tax=Ceraceosorus guamensis TaxID=1522189 RepID=A0A316W9P4_9BASI|nr:hypothetical protein IE81DRAFT_18808 [Ceraceosorus guamensis]PWN44385.1 hypothetical protein IE81DRAFT_18808 [Ceraceosorus guamensis]
MWQSWAHRVAAFQVVWADHGHVDVRATRCSKEMEAGLVSAQAVENQSLCDALVQHGAATVPESTHVHFRIAFGEIVSRWLNRKGGASPWQRGVEQASEAAFQYSGDLATSTVKTHRKGNLHA